MSTPENENLPKKSSLKGSERKESLKTEVPEKKDSLKSEDKRRSSGGALPPSPKESRMSLTSPSAMLDDDDDDDDTSIGEGLKKPKPPITGNTTLTDGSDMEEHSLDEDEEEEWLEVETDSRNTSALKTAKTGSGGSEGSGGTAGSTGSEVSAPGTDGEKKKLSKKKKSTAEGGGVDEQASDFGQEEVEKAKEADKAIREKRASWTGEPDEEEDEDYAGGGMQDLIGRSTAKKEQAEPEVVEKKRRRRKRKASVHEKIEKKPKTPAAEGEDEEEEEEEAPVTEQVWVEPVYNADDFVSGSIAVADCTVPEKIIRFYYSYGYDTHRRNNVQVLDEENIVYISGNYVHFYSLVENKILLLRRSASGYGLGHIAVHPSRQYFAVAEKGDFPYIMIYTWPGIEIHRILRKGTTRGYAYINFNPSGELLCSQGMAPDYLLTIWDWQHEKIILRYKAFSQEVYRATFSRTNPGDLITSGLGHIRFWRMAETFTGLKLQGLIGRFGKTEISDICGFAGLSDGKVCSGSEWGNMLIWDGGLISVEVGQKQGKNCHAGEITDLVHQDTELVTIGGDGYLRIWETEQLDLASTGVDDSGKCELEPMFELKLASNSILMSAVRAVNDEANIWFVQDAFGKIWSANLTTAMANPDYLPETLFYAPGGAINGIGVSPTYTIMMIGSEGGHLWGINYVRKDCIARKIYPIPVTKIIWLPLKYDPEGMTFLVGFGDGVLRLMTLHFLTEDEIHKEVDVVDHEEEALPYELYLLLQLRFHKGRVLVMQIDQENDVLYTCGADKVIFGSRIYWDDDTAQTIIQPLSFVTAPFAVVSLDLHPIKDYRMIIASRGGRVAECRRPIWGDMDTSITYNQGKLHGRRWWYKSVKSFRRREEHREARKKEKEEKLEELYKDIQKRRDLGIMVDEDLEVGRLHDKYRRQQAAEDDEELYIPEKPCPVLAIYYHINKALVKPSTPLKTFFMHVGDYDSGYIYECRYNRPTAGGFHPVPPTPPFETDVGVKCFLLSDDNEFLLFGMTDGTIRVMPKAIPPKVIAEKVSKKDKKKKKKVSSSDEGSAGSRDSQDLEAQQKKKAAKAIPPFPTSFFPYDLKNFWLVPMHDPDRGAVNQLCWSPDYQFLFSVGEDGSIFSYRWDPLSRLTTANDELTASLVPDIRLTDPEVVDNHDPNALTLEELKSKAEADRIAGLTEAKKEIIRKDLRKLKIDFRSLVQRNEEIPEQFRVPRLQFDLDPRIKEPRNRRMMEEVEEVYRRWEWDGCRSVIACQKVEKFFLSSIETPHIVIKDLEGTLQVHTFRHRFLTPEFLNLCAKNKDWMIDEDLLLNAEDEAPPPPKALARIPVKRYYAKDLIGGFEGKKYDVKTIQAIRTLEERLSKRYVRECEWADLNALRVPDDYEAPEDIAAIKWASAHMGDYKLKTSEEYLGEKITTAKRRQRVLDLKMRIYHRIVDFNVYVRKLQKEKVGLIKKCRKIEAQIKELHKLMPMDYRKPIPQIKDMEPIEDPEKLFTISDVAIREKQDKKIEAAGLTKRKQLVDEKMFSIKQSSESQPSAQKGKRIIHKEGDFRRGKNDPRAPVVVLTKPTVSSSQQGQSYFKAMGKTALEGLALSVWKYRKSFFNPKTDAMTKRKDVVVAERCFQRDELLDRLNKIISYFKQRVSDVRNERVELQLDIKLMSLGLLVLIQELDIVKEFDSAEKTVLERLKAQKVECVTAKERLEKVRKRLNRAKSDQEKVEESIVRIQKDVAGIIGEKGRFADYLWKVYRKKVKIITNEDEDEMEIQHHSSSEGTDSSNSTSVDSTSDLFKLPKMKFDLNICPEALDKSVYTKICDLRQKRAHLELDVEAQKRVVEKIARDFNEVEKVFQRFEGRLDGIGQEVSVLQRKKQIRMNELKILIVFKADQIQCLEETEADRSHGNIIERLRNNFPNLEDVIVFPKDGTAKLDTRIEELKSEIVKEKAKQQRARHMIVRLREELHKKEHSVKLLEGDCKKDMTSKFGRIVDLDELCACIINLDILDALLLLESRRNKHYLERDKLARRIEETRWSLTDVTKVNSEYNTLLAILEERQRDVDYFLYKQNKSGTTQLAYEQSESREFDADNQDVVEEMYMLEDRLMNQEGKIAYLREIIATGRLKYGIPPIVPLTCVQDDIGSRFMTLQELREYKEYRNTEVETLYKKENITNRLLTSESQVPFFDESRFIRNSAEMEEDEAENQLEDEAEGEYSLTPTGDDAFEEEYYGEDGEYQYRPSYPINVITDDQMPQTDPETDNNTEEEDYMSDPIPVGMTVGTENNSASQSRKTSEAKPPVQEEMVTDTSQAETEEDYEDEEVTATENEEEEDFDLAELEQLLRHEE